MENTLRQKAKELLASGEVNLVIGYEAGSVPFKSTPLFARTSEDAARLIWNPSCVNNLTVYLKNAAKNGKVAVVVKPCDARSVVELIKENQVARDGIKLIAMPCPGVLNLDGLDEIDLGEIKSVAWNDGGVAVGTESEQTVIPREKAFQGKCLTCKLGDPESADIKIGDSPGRDSAEDKYAAVEEYEKMSPEDRRAFWAKQFEKCIRCYACRDVCPGCYCTECFVDKPGQLWILRSTDPNSNWFFHMTRAIHLAGRCIGCAECERACPMGIPMSLLGKKLDADVGEMFDYEAGEDPESLPAFGDFKMDDPDPCPE